MTYNYSLHQSKQSYDVHVRVAKWIWLANSVVIGAEQENSMIGQQCRYWC